MLNIATSRPLLRALFSSLVDALIFALSGLLAFGLRFEFAIPDQIRPYVVGSVLLWAVMKVAVFKALQVDRGPWRYVSILDVTRIGMANLIGSSLSMLLILTFQFSALPRSLFLLEFVICTLGTCAARLVVRMLHDSPWRGRRIGKAILVYGAGAAGINILRELRSNHALGYIVRGLIDDNAQKKGLYIQETRVLGSGRELASIAEARHVDEIWIAIPSATGPELLDIYTRCQNAGLRTKIVPGLRDIIEGTTLSNQVRDVAVDDLLGRSPVTLDDLAINKKICGETILVTGAAGSIGSELCQQIARFRPAAIVAYEISESALFKLEQDFLRTYPGITFFPEIGNIQNLQRIREVFDFYRPAIVFHAAAYKHVPMMETHVFEAVENNVFGTLNLAQVSLEYAVKHFVMISSDKAVRPTSIMGATKRVAEMVVHSLQGQTDIPHLVSVRFGNVLGSNGSVVPIFKEQIVRGGPITVTHPDMRRYFMTIPEAAQLVLQAFTMGKGGEIFVLDMGEPIRIVDLARNLIRLSGLRPDTDIAIHFTGTRPGEKLMEELNGSDEDTLPTCHNKIQILAGGMPEWSRLNGELEQLRKACADRHLRRLVLSLQALVPEYNPSTEIMNRAFHPQLHRNEGERAATAVVG